MDEIAYRVLIVDDSAEDRHTFRRYLNQGKYSFYIVSEAETAEEGLQRCDAETPDCVLLDYNLPDLDGLEFLKRLNERQLADHPAVVMLTGQGNEAIAVNAMKAGAQDYLVKGLARGEVGRAVHIAIENVILRRQIQARERDVSTLSIERVEMIKQLAARAEALAEADRRKDEFLATLAHELRNPLAPISNALHVLLKSALNEQDARNLYEIMQRQTNHMVRLVDDLMEISRITRGKLEVRLESVDLHAVILSSIEASKPLLDRARHALSVELPDKPVMVSADKVRLAQVFTNLLNNAAKFTDEGGRIGLSVKVFKRTVAISVRDNGIGIPPEMLPKVFDIFTQIDTTLNRAHGGLGIGLTLASTLTALHSGTLEAHSAGPGKGSEFVVTLPIVHTIGGESHDAESAADASAQATSKRRVLVTDDNQDSARSLAMLVSILGAETHVTHDGPSALAIMPTFRPDLVVLDIGMPGMDGYELAAEIRKMKDFEHVRIVALTGWGQSEDIRRAQSAGVDRHLVKPIELATLKELLAELSVGDKV